ncbi:MAG: glycosyltransferase family 2 protein [Desulfurococcales archaeon]|nr:glycosyltransferase family 2 protein [Desulfurococcales archaeon]
MIIEKNRCKDQKPLISIVIPTYNEAEVISETLRRVKDSLKGLDRCFEIIVVDDDSPDGTWRIASEVFDKEDINGKIIVRENVRGLGTAIIDGIRSSEGEYVCVIDADLQHPPEEILRMLKKALEEDYDLVIASRYVKGGGVEGWRLHRRIISKTAVFIARLLIPHIRGIKDPMSGYFLFRKDRVRIDRLKGDGMKILLEIVVTGDIKKIYEHPYIFHRRVRGKSKLGVKEIIDFIKQILRLSDYKIVKFGLVGLSGIGVNWGILIPLRDIIGLPLPISYLISLEISTISNFIFNDLWTFSKNRREKSWFRRLVEYHSTLFVGLAINYVATNLLAFTTYYLIASLIGILLGFIANYIISSEFVWGLRSSRKYY